MKIQLQGDSRDTPIRREDTSFPCCTHVGCGEHLASLRAELDQLRDDNAVLAREVEFTRNVIHQFYYTFLTRDDARRWIEVRCATDASAALERARGIHQAEERGK